MDQKSKAGAQNGLFRVAQSKRRPAWGAGGRRRAGMLGDQEHGGLWDVQVPSAKRWGRKYPQGPSGPPRDLQASGVPRLFSGCSPRRGPTPLPAAGCDLAIACPKLSPRPPWWSSLAAAFVSPEHRLSPVRGPPVLASAHLLCALAPGVEPAPSLERPSSPSRAYSEPPAQG